MATLSTLSSHLQEPTDVLFRDLVVTEKRPGRGAFGVGFSTAGHVLILVLAVLVPVLWPEDLPAPEGVRALLYNPPPPPPPPLPKGSALVEKKERPQPVTEQPQKAPVLEMPEPDEPVEVREDRAPASEQFGSEQGSDEGLLEGMDGGQVGGQVGGVLGGTLGGCVGCTGDDPVADFDEPPKILLQPKPAYPQDAFVKKIEGIVVLQILIDATGRVRQARVVQSIPVLNQAAIDCALKWQFKPAMKHGRPVATLANAPVTFKIY